MMYAVPAHWALLVVVLQGAADLGIASTAPIVQKHGKRYPFERHLPVRNLKKSKKVSSSKSESGNDQTISQLSWGDDSPSKRAKSAKISKSSKTTKSQKSEKRVSSKTQKSSKASTSSKTSKSSKSHDKATSQSVDDRSDFFTPAPTNGPPSPPPSTIRATTPTEEPTGAPTMVPQSTLSPSVSSRSEISSDDMEVCRCDESNACSDKPLQRGQDLRLCFLMTPTKSIDAIQSLYLDQEGLVYVDIIMAGLQVHEGASISCNDLRENCIFTIPMLDEFYNEDEPPDVMAKGSALISSLQVVVGASSSFERGTRQLNQLEVQFVETIKLEKTVADEVEDEVLAPPNNSSNRSLGYGIGASIFAVLGLGLGYLVFQRGRTPDTMAETVAETVAEKG